MRTLRSDLIRVLMLVTLSLLGGCLEASTKAGKAEVGVVLDLSTATAKAHCKVVNNGKVALWFPHSHGFPYRYDLKTNTLMIWAGYFDNVGPSDAKEHYIIPEQISIGPGQSRTIEFEDQDLIRELARPAVVLEMHIRLATRFFPHTNVRGMQPIDDYLKHSVVIRSSTIEVKR